MNENHRFNKNFKRLLKGIGIKWADANPKPLWISVKNDLPYYHEYLLDTDISTKKY